ncbi:MAG: hypothetical protein ACK4FF_01300 [Limnobacter sp.]|uniref:hypothetical protein n=1 Tax=Limnobacter sp. TaxID=2003368 RepID=UPI003919FB48
MMFKKIALVAALSVIVLPTASRADTVTLMGWGNAFAQAHAQQSQAAMTAKGEGVMGLQLGQIKAPAPAATPEAPAPVAAAPKTGTPVADVPKGDTPKAEAPATEVAKAGLLATKNLQAKADGLGGGAQASLTAGLEVSSGLVQGVLGQVDATYVKAGTAVEGVTAGAFNLLQGVADRTSGVEITTGVAGAGNLAVGNLAAVSGVANLAATASLVNGGQLGAITSMTSGLVQNLIAARPASLLGILR